MIVHVHENELWPCYSISETKIGHAEIEMTEEELANWRKAADEFFHAQAQIQRKITQFEAKKIDLRYLDSIFDGEHPSRREKTDILLQFGWTQTDTSEWEHHGRKARLHEAFEECRQIYESSKND